MLFLVKLNLFDDMTWLRRTKLNVNEASLNLLSGAFLDNDLFLQIWLCLVLMAFQENCYASVCCHYSLLHHLNEIDNHFENESSTMGMDIIRGSCSLSYLATHAAHSTKECMREVWIRWWVMVSVMWSLAASRKTIELNFISFIVGALRR